MKVSWQDHTIVMKCTLNAPFLLNLQVKLTLHILASAEEHFIL